MTARLPRTVADASPPPSSSPVIGLEGVSKVFELNERAFTAVEEISFAVDDGQFCSIIGPSGCGKST
ncbi:MAG: ABC transporter ATP-binding protein, partial [Actinomycetota bacterium]